VSEQELEVTETELEESADITAEAGDESEVESSAPESDDADFDDAAEAEGDAASGESTDALAAAAATAAADPAEEFKAKLRRQEGDWYVIHSYAGYENRVKANLETRIQTLDMEDYIFEIQVPMEEVVEIKNAQRKVINRVRIPGYVLVRMDLTDASWGAVRHTPGVTGFVGNAHNPSGRGLRSWRVRYRQGRSVRDPSRHHLRDQGRIPDPRGPGFHLRARNAGHPGVQPGHQDLISQEFVPALPA
jgi:transcriptional antiterminator NusG